MSIDDLDRQPSTDGDHSLGKSASFTPSGTTSDPEEDGSRSKIDHADAEGVDRRRAVRTKDRYRRLRGLAEFTTDKSVRGCMSPLGKSDVLIGRRDGFVKIRNVATCSKVWFCPVCSAKIRAARAADVQLAMTLHEKSGGGLSFLTLTQQHSRADALKDQLDTLSDVWTGVQKSRAYQAAKRRLGVVGHITALEVTWTNRSGWHAHRHIALLLEAPVSDDRIAEFESVVYAEYAKRLHKLGRPVGEQGVLVRVDNVRVGDGSAVGKYLNKIALEMARQDMKTSRDTDGLDPFSILDIAIGDRAHRLVSQRQAVAMWREYETAMQGKSSVRFSRGLRDRLGMDEARTDEDIAAGDLEGEFIAPEVAVTHAVWRSAWRDALVGSMLSAFSLDGLDGFTDVLVRNGYTIRMTPKLISLSHGSASMSGDRRTFPPSGREDSNDEPVWVTLVDIA